MHFTEYSAKKDTSHFFLNKAIIIFIIKLETCTAVTFMKGAKLLKNVGKLFLVIHIQ